MFINVYKLKTDVFCVPFVRDVKTRKIKWINVNKRTKFITIEDNLDAVEPSRNVFAEDPKGF